MMVTETRVTDHSIQPVSWQPLSSLLSTITGGHLVVNQKWPKLLGNISKNKMQLPFM